MKTLTFRPILDYALFVFWGLVFISPAEFGINLFIVPEPSLKKFVGAVLVYIVLLSLYYRLYIIKLKRSPAIEQGVKTRLIESVLLGGFGLFIMEWLLIGNSPTGNPDAIQSSMFIWWIFVCIFPKIMTLPEYATTRAWILTYHILFSTTFYVVPILIGKPLAGAFIYSYGLLVFYIFLFLYIKNPGYLFSRS